MSKYTFNCTPTFKLYHHRFCGLGLHPRTDTTVFRANIQKKGKYYKRNLFEKLEDALQWLIDATPIYIEEENLSLQALIAEHQRTRGNEQIDKDIDKCRSRIRELQRFLLDVKLQQRIYLSSPLTQPEIEEAMRLWRQRDFSLAGRITLRDRNSRAPGSSRARARYASKVAKKRRRSSSGTRSRTNKKYVRKLPSHFQFHKLNLKLEQISTDAGVSSCMRCCGAFNPRSSSANRSFCRNCDKETSISQFKPYRADSTRRPKPSSNVFHKPLELGITETPTISSNSFSLNELELPPRSRSDAFVDDLSLKSFHDYLPDLPPLSADEYSPRNIEQNPPLKQELPQIPDHQESIFDLLNEPIKIDNSEPDDFKVKVEANTWTTPEFYRQKKNNVMENECPPSPQPTTPFDVTSMFSGARAVFAGTSLGIFSRALYHLLSGDLKGFVQNGTALIKKLGEYIESQEGVFINMHYETENDFAVDFESLQLWNQAVHSAKVFRECEVSGAARRSRRFQLDKPEMYEMWNKGYSRALSYLEDNANECMKVITVNYQSPGVDRSPQKEMAQLVRLPETLLYQFLSGMESCGLRSDSCEPMSTSGANVEFYFNYRRFSRPQIGLFESFGVGPNFIRREGHEFYVFETATNNWVLINQRRIIRKVRDMPAFVISREMERYHDPESSYQHFEKELYEILFRDVIKLE